MKHTSSLNLLEVIAGLTVAFFVFEGMAISLAALI